MKSVSALNDCIFESEQGRSCTSTDLCYLYILYIDVLLARIGIHLGKAQTLSTSIQDLSHQYSAVTTTGYVFCSMPDI